MRKPADTTPAIIIVTGPTASGKTGFAIELAKRFDGEIIGADSMQVYRYMDIGTAKPTPAEQAAAPHHLIDVVDPDAAFDAAAYAAMASACIDAVTGRGRVAIVTGGTGFYIKALMYGLFDEGPSDADIRQALKARAEAEGSAPLHEALSRIDAEAARKIHPNDTYRITRALEIYQITGKPPSAVQQAHGFKKPRFNALTLGLSWPRPVLYDRINQRVDQMMAQGFLEEVEQLLKRGWHRELKSMQSLGYRHLAAVVEEEIRMAEAVETLKRDHRHYAKRQMTWFGADPNAHWISPDRPDLADERIRSFLALNKY
ncbi:tRNA (adenosine(37)-N6)-dimethylallyltransferase MiaA [Desulfosarcina sp. OttesenSCG-928-G10]|nr:tRNA (adenosine(37)-N6)-dimethylallyltransferase MiaA [Desulfosarcina sp. OttesenSCG-928-G10]